MSKTILNATDVRNDFFRLLDLVVESKKTIFIKRGKEVKVKMEPVGDELDKDWEETKRLLDKTRGMWADRTEEEIRGPFREADRKSTARIRSRKW